MRFKKLSYAKWQIIKTQERDISLSSNHLLSGLLEVSLPDFERHRAWRQVGSLRTALFPVRSSESEVVAMYNRGKEYGLLKIGDVPTNATTSASGE